ncbi:MAG: DNA repair exonuclease [Rubellimicrobium sp.]|nr:DNA repair exonuclease [Rubellimicrobium sp.]
MFRFLHSADLHLGKPFGRFPEEVRGSLREARTALIPRLAEAARAADAEAVLLAGDTFDSESPAPAVIRQALNAIAADPGLAWVILPGNHDSLAATPLWERVRREAPPNLCLALDPQPIALGDAAVVLPAPATARRPGRDLTDDLDQPTAPGLMRIGLAHGAVTSFSAGEDDGPAVIPPDRAERSGLDYLALGDWHGQIGIGARTWYAGTPEADSFRHARAGAVTGAALVVSLAGPGAVPVVESVATGRRDWRQAEIALLPGEDVAGRLRTALPLVVARAVTLLSLRLEGRLGLAARDALQAELAEVGPDFLHLEADLSGLAPVHDPADLDRIDRGGALRTAAEALAAEEADPDRAAQDSAVAAEALQHLFAFARAADS